MLAQVKTDYLDSKVQDDTDMTLDSCIVRSKCPQKADESGEFYISCKKYFKSIFVLQNFIHLILNFHL